MHISLFVIFIETNGCKAFVDVDSIQGRVYVANFSLGRRETEKKFGWQKKEKKKRTKVETSIKKKINTFSLNCPHKVFDRFSYFIGLTDLV